MTTKEQDPVFRFFNEIGIINQLATAEFARVLAPHGINPSEFGVLNHLIRVGGGNSPTRLARIFQVAKPSMTATLQKLDSKGLIQIIPSEKDRRKKTVEITAKGSDLCRSCIQSVQPLAKVLSETLDVDRLIAMIPILTELREFLDDRRNTVDRLS